MTSLLFSPRSVEHLRPWVAGAVLLCLATLPFAGSVSARRLWDDSHYVFDNPTLQDRVHGVARIWAGEFLMDYYPVPQTVLWAEYGWFGEDARGYRVANILLHAVGAIAVWWAAATWRLPWPWLMAALWACHPAHCDAVCWISQHKSTVAAIFFATALALAAKPAAWLPLAVCAHGMACLSKTDAVTLPAVLVALELYRRRSDDSLAGTARSLVPRILPFAVVSLVTAAGAARFMASRVVTTPIDLGSPLERLLKAGWAVCFYVADTVWPVRLAAAYPVPELRADDPVAWVPLASVVAAVAGLSVLASRGRSPAARAALAGSGAFIAMLAPVLMILPQGFFATRSWPIGICTCRCSQPRPWRQAAQRHSRPSPVGGKRLHLRPWSSHSASWQRPAMRRHIARKSRSGGPRSLPSRGRGIPTMASARPCSTRALTQPPPSPGSKRRPRGTGSIL